MKASLSIIGASALLATAASAQEHAAPPSFRLVKEGPAWVGYATKRAKDLIPQHTEFAAALASETPGHSVAVDGVYLQVTEVTNEQYAAFVRSTDRQPPIHWGRAALDEKLREWNEAQFARQKEEPSYSPVPFNRAGAWETGWQDLAWAVPEGMDAFPVVYVSYGDALAYARWVGARLPTESEFARAARGSDKGDYPWGPEWDQALSANANSRSSLTQVGGFPGGAGPFGHLDLVGNVWEWTSSRFEPHPGFKVLTVKNGKKRVRAEPMWDGSQRVAVGGCYQNSEFIQRISIRRPTDPYQVVEALGFRCAKNPAPGRDLLAVALEEDVRISALGRGVEFGFDATVGLESYSSREGRSKVEGYAVVTGYRAIAASPANGLPYRSAAQLNRDARKDGAPVVGLLATTDPLLEPALEPGIYVVRYRPSGDPVQAKAENGKKDKDGSDESARQAMPAPPRLSMGQDPVPELPYDHTVNQFLFYDVLGQYAGSQPAAHEPEKADRKDLCAVSVDKATGLIGLDLICLQARSKTRAFKFRLELKADPASLADL